MRRTCSKPTFIAALADVRAAARALKQATDRAARARSAVIDTYEGDVLRVHGYSLANGSSALGLLMPFIRLFEVPNTGGTTGRNPVELAKERFTGICSSV